MRHAEFISASFRKDPKLVRDDKQLDSRFPFGFAQGERGNDIQKNLKINTILRFNES